MKKNTKNTKDKYHLHPHLRSLILQAPWRKFKHKNKIPRKGRDREIADPGK